MAAVRPRWVLHLQAQMWRFLMGIGMLLHRTASPRPPKPSFVRSIPSTVSTKEGNFKLHFYVPDTYENAKRMNFPRTSSKPSTAHRKNKGFPCIVNFHGGGFTLGDPTDDARWCGTVVEQLDAVVVSVDYRRAPEHPFPTAIEDGVDAVLYIAQHAEELGIDADKIALSGFSSGANMAFTVPLRLYDHMTSFSRTLTEDETSNNQNLCVPAPSGRPQTLAQMANASATSVNRILRSRSEMHIPQHEQEQYLTAQRTRTATTSSATKGGAHMSAQEIPSVQICAIVPWYPSCDYTQTREQRRSTTVRKDQELPSLFTDLFDEIYLHPPDTIPLDSPYLSPGIADTALLREALPQEIIMHTCEWDMLLAEGIKFKDRLIAPDIGKKVTYVMVEGVPHGWDKAPNPIKPTPGVKEHYLRACKELRRVFHAVDKNGFGAGVFNAQEGSSRETFGAESAISEESEGDLEIEDGQFARRGRRESRLVN